MRSLLPDHILTSHAFLRDLQKLKTWHEQIRNLTQTQIKKYNLPVVDELEITRLKHRQNEVLSGIFDEISIIGSSGDESIRQAEKYLKFLQTNPMRKYISRKRLVNGKCYADFEKEFMMYYDMIQR